MNTIQPQDMSEDDIMALLGDAPEGDDDTLDSDVQDVDPVEKQVDDEAQASDRPRDEFGRFAKKEGEAENEAAEQQQPTAQTEEVQQQQQPVDAPPARFNEAAKAQWASLPPETKAEIQRGFQNLENGLQQYQQEFGGFVKEYANQLKQNGGSLQQAVQDFAKLEQGLLSQDPRTQGATLSEILRRANIDPITIARNILGGEAPDQQAVHMQSQLMQASQEIQQLRSAVSQYEEYYKQQAQAEVDNLRQQHKNFDELLPYAEMFINQNPRINIQQALQMAKRLIPDSPEPATPAASNAAGMAGQIPPSASQVDWSKKAAKAAKQLTGTTPVPRSKSPADMSEDEIKALIPD